MDPRLAHFGALRESLLQTAHEESNTLKLFSIESILPFWRRTPPLTFPKQLLGCMIRTLQGVFEIIPRTLSLIRLQVVHHCISDARLNHIVNERLADPSDASRRAWRQL